jgi:hypothetical protein
MIELNLIYDTSRFGLERAKLEDFTVWKGCLCIMINFRYDPVFKYLCVQNCIFHILNTLGCENSKHIMRCPINYQAEKLQISSLRSGFNISFKRPNSTKRVLRFVDVKAFSSQDAETIWSENKEMLKNRMPFIAMVDVYYLYYRKEYGKLHGSHAVIVIDYLSITIM